MKLVTRITGAVRGLVQKKRDEQDLDDELREYLNAAIERHMAAGLNREDATRAARVELGSFDSVKEQVRRVGWESFVEAFAKDVAHGIHVLWRNKTFTAVAVLSLALGIGANTAIFQLINAVRLRTLPVSNPQELAAVQVSGKHDMWLSNGFNSDLTFGLWQQIRQHQEAFSGVFAWSDTQLLLGSGASAELVRGLWVSGDAFSVLRVLPARGRLFTSADDTRGCGLGTAVISYDFWQNRFGGDDSAVGKTLTMFNHSVQIVGVTPKGFFGMEVGKSFDVALPICAEKGLGNATDSLDVWWLVVMGRLKPGWSITRASDHLKALSPALFEATVPPGYDQWHDETYRKLRLIATPAGNGASRLRVAYDKPLWLLLAMTGMVLLVACVNLANLMLARATVRERETAIRIAIGASRRRVVFQFLTESVVLALTGSVFGIALSYVLSRRLVLLLNTQADPILIDIALDWRVLAFTAAVAVSTCIIFGLVPALRSSRVGPAAAIKTAGRGLSDSRERFSLQRLLVASQIAISLVLLAGSFLFVRSFRNLTTIDAGFSKKDIVFMAVNYMNHPPNQRASYQKQLLEDVRTTRGVKSAALTTHVPLNGGSWTLAIDLPSLRGQDTGSKFTYISSGYFETMDVPLVYGRDFNDFDRKDSRGVAIVNETFVRRLVQSANPIGWQFRTVAEPGNPATEYEIVGVAKDTKYSNLREEIPPTAFVPEVQNPLQERPFINVVIRSSENPEKLVADLKRKFNESHPDLLVDFTVFEKQIEDGLSRDRLMAWLAGFFGVLAAILAVTGLYGLISYILQRRIHEIGIRVALGATRGSVIALVLRQTACSVLIGLAVGVPVYLATSQSAAALLFDLSPNDVPTMIAACSLLVVIAGLATFAPAWRASRIDPMIALRDE
jgi:predicted permease